MSGLGEGRLASCSVVLEAGYDVSLYDEGERCRSRTGWCPVRSNRKIHIGLAGFVTMVVERTITVRSLALVGRGY